PFVSIIATDTIAVNQTIKDGQTIVSAQETFELGFFSPGNNTQNRYLGIWYKRLAAGTIAWVANRKTPIKNKFGELTLKPNGILVLRDTSTNRTIWSSDTFRATRIPVAKLFDSGNLIVVNNNDDNLENYIWQSFDHPTNTFLPGTRFGRNLERGVVRNVTSWKSVDDPSPGPYMVYMDFNGFPQIFQKNGDVIQFRLGIWNGLGFTGMPSMRPNPIFTVRYVSNEVETYSDFSLINASVLSRLSLSPLGDMSWWNWIDRTQGWFLYMTPTVDNCVRYALCGVYGSCDIEQSPACECLKGFTPKMPDQWDISDWTGGCRREIPLDCGAGDGFRKYSSLKLPDARQSWFDTNMTLEQCEMKCRNECNCTAYTTLDIKDNIGCLLWYDELTDMRKFSNNGQDIYIRMAAAELEKDRNISKNKKPIKVILIPLAAGLAILLGLCVLIIKKKKKWIKNPVNEEIHDQIEQNDFINLPLFSLSKLLVATNHFSSKNKLGEGGFGPVY
ncbi:hypothetical protein M8C21_003146, partial [Ambrosia artemisiifolia]